VGSDVQDISIANLLGHLIEMTREYKIDARPEFLLLQKTLLLVEGVGAILYPKINIWNLGRPWIKEWAKTNIGFDAKIRDLVFDFIQITKKFLRNN
jgi:ubiquinone biosynthesis protein